MRPLVAEIRLAHLRHNYRVLKEMHGQNLLAVVKADAYGVSGRSRHAARKRD